MGNFIAHAAEVIAQAAMQVFNVVANAVKAAVEVIVDVLSAAVEWIKEMAARALNAITNGIKDAMQGLIDIFSAIGVSIYNAIFKGEIDNTVFKKIVEFMSSPFINMLNTLPMVISGIYFAITAATLGIGALVMSFLQGYLVQLIINAIVSGLSQLHMTIPIIGNVLGIPATLLIMIAKVLSLNQINAAVAAMGFAGTLLGAMIAAWIYGGPGVAQKAIVEASEILSTTMSGLSTGILDYDDFIDAITEVQNKLESKRSLFGKFPEYSNKLFVTPINDLRQSRVVESVSIVIAVGNFIAHVAEVIAKAAMAVFDVVANAVKS